MLRSIDNIIEARNIIEEKMELLFGTMTCVRSDFLVQNDFLSVTVCGDKLLRESDPVIIELIRFWLRCGGILAPPKVRVKEFIRQIRQANVAGRPELNLRGEDFCYKMFFSKGQIWLEQK